MDQFNVPGTYFLLGVPTLLIAAFLWWAAGDVGEDAVYYLAWAVGAVGAAQVAIGVVAHGVKVGLIAARSGEQRH